MRSIRIRCCGRWREEREREREREKEDSLFVAINAVIFFHALVPRHAIEKLFIVSDDDELEFALLARNRIRESE